MKNKIFKNASIVLLVLISFLLQTSFVPYIELGIATPNLVVITVVSIGFMFGPDEGMLAGILAGVLNDMMFSEFLALYVLIYLTLGYMAGAIAKLYFGDLKRVLFALIFVEDLIYGLIMYVLFFLLRGRFFIFTYIFNNIIPCAIYTLAIGFIIAPIISLIYKIYVKIKIKEEDSIA